MQMDRQSKKISQNKIIRKEINRSYRPTGARAIRRFIPMMWIDQTITLNNETLDRLHRVSLILEKGQYAHQSLKLIYIIIALVSMIAILVMVEFMFFNRRVRFSKGAMLNRIRCFLF